MGMSSVSVTGREGEGRRVDLRLGWGIVVEDDE
jgi:hypothetical protein